MVKPFQAKKAVKELNLAQLINIGQYKFYQL